MHIFHSIHLNKYASSFYICYHESSRKFPLGAWNFRFIQIHSDLVPFPWEACRMKYRYYLLFLTKVCEVFSVLQSLPIQSCNQRYLDWAVCFFGKCLLALYICSCMNVREKSVLLCCQLINAKLPLISTMGPCVLTKGRVSDEAIRMSFHLPKQSRFYGLMPSSGPRPSSPQLQRVWPLTAPRSHSLSLMPCCLGQSLCPRREGAAGFQWHFL